MQMSSAQIGHSQEVGLVFSHRLQRDPANIKPTFLHTKICCINRTEYL